MNDPFFIYLSFYNYFQLKLKDLRQKKHPQCYLRIFSCGLIRRFGKGLEEQLTLKIYGI